MSRKIAVVGGSGGIGRHVLDELVHQKKHQIALLSREERKEFSDLGVDVKVVDYTSFPSVKQALQGVDTVISFILSDDHVIYENLIRASEEVGVRRFIPSEFAHDIQAFPDPNLSMYKPKEHPRALLEKSRLEYTLIGNGLFMDYLLPKGAKKHLQDVPIPVDVENATAVIPGTGEPPITLTLADDIAKAVAELIDEPAWEKHTNIAGETTTWNKILYTAEKITGKKFAVTYKSKKEIEDAKATANSQWGHFMAEVDLVYAEGALAIRNAHHFKSVRYTSVEELLQRTYGKAK